MKQTQKKYQKFEQKVLKQLKKEYEQPLEEATWRKYEPTKNSKKKEKKIILPHKWRTFGYNV